MADPVEVEWREGSLVCHLPLTRRTGKVRLKRDGAPIPGGIRDKKLGVELNLTDYIEWQISYGTTTSLELSQMLDLGLQNGLLKKTEMEEAKKSAEAVSRFFDTSFRIDEKPSGSKFEGFDVSFKHSPVLRKQVGPGYRETIQIELQEKQFAIGFMSMLYLLIPLSSLPPSEQKRLQISGIGQNEKVQWRAPKEIPIAVAMAFSIASKQHRDDIVLLLRRCLGR